MDKSGGLSTARVADAAARAMVEFGAAYAARAHEGEAAARGSWSGWQDFVTSVLTAPIQPPDLGLDPNELRLYVDAVLFRDIDVDPSTLVGRWFPVCQVDCVPQPSTFRTVQWFQESLVVRRTAADGISVSANICPHRQAPVFVGAGAADSVQCFYHGWRFGLDGKCQDIPMREAFGDDVEPCRFALHDLPTRVVDGWVYVATEPGVAPVFERPSRLAANVAARLADHLHAADTTYATRSHVGEPEIPYVWRLLFRVGFVSARLRRLVEGSSPRWGTSGNPDIAVAKQIDLRQALLIVHRHCPAVETWPEWTLAMNRALVGPVPSGGPAPDHLLQQLPETEGQTLPVWAFGDEQLFPLEVEALIRRNWHFVCHENEIPDEGDHCRTDIIGERVFAYRAGDGQVRAGRWATDRPSDPRVNDLSRFPLDPVPVLSSKGFVFVRLEDEGEDLVWELPDTFDCYRSSELWPIRGGGWVDFVADTDYKVIWDNFNETLHFPTTHPMSWKLFDYSLYSVRLRETPSPGLNEPERVYYDSIVEAASHDWAREAALVQQFETDGTLDEPLQYGHLSLAPQQQLSATCLGITLFPDHFHIIAVTPGGPRSCYVRSRCYGLRLDPAKSRDRALMRARLVNTDILGLQLTLEDMNVTNLAQSSYTSRVFRQCGVLSELECSIGEFNRHYQRVLPVARYRERPSGELLRPLQAALSARRR